MTSFEFRRHPRDGGDRAYPFNFPAQPCGTPACAGASAKSEI